MQIRWHNADIENDCCDYGNYFGDYSGLFWRLFGNYFAELKSKELDNHMLIPMSRPIAVCTQCQQDSFQMPISHRHFVIVPNLGIHRCLCVPDSQFVLNM